LPAHRLQQAGLGDGDARHLAQALAQLGRQRLGAARALLAVDQADVDAGVGLALRRAGVEVVRV
jgi:hypothetical protein